MFGLIIFAYPLALVTGLVLGARLSALQSILWSGGVGATLAALFSLEYITEVSFQWLFVQMIVPASAICAGIGITGAVIGIAVKLLFRVFRWID